MGRCLTIAFVLAVGLLASGPALPVHAQAGADSVARWSPEFSAPMALTAQDGALSMAVDTTGLWVGAESAVTRYENGQWEERQQPPGSGGLFALAPQGLDAWAFGYQGAVWRRSGGRWSAVASPTGADLYAAATRSADEVWAVGFDYESEAGTLLRVRGRDLQAFTEPWLEQIQLYSLAAAPSGELWAGGCSYVDTPFLMRDGGNGVWRPVAAPLSTGCIYHLSFAPTGFGLAAASSDVLWFDGDAWNRSELTPPAGLAWLRVAALGPNTDTSSFVPGTGWAIPAVPNWRGYVKGDTPWYFDGVLWQLGRVDFGSYERMFGPGDETATNRPYAALAGDGQLAWSVAVGPSGQLGLLQLESGTGRLLHPRIEQALDIATASDGAVWVSGGGDAVLIGRVNALWRDGEPAPSGSLGRAQMLDLAGDQAGWALERANGNEGTRAWRLVGLDWEGVATPRSPVLGRVRALPDGRAWAVDMEGQLLSWQAGAWSPLVGAPSVPISSLGNATTLRAPTPFDITLAAGQVVGCVAGADGMYRFADGVFQRVASGVTRYVDVQLVDAQHGWALPDPDSYAPLTPTLARLVDCVPEPLYLASGRFGPRLGPFQVMSFVGTDMVWLYRGFDFSGGPQLVGWRPSEATPFFADLDGCAIRSLAATTAPGGGVDLWLASPMPVSGRGTNMCGPATDAPILAYSSLVSRLHVDEVVRTLHLPILGLGWRVDDGG